MKTDLRSSFDDRLEEVDAYLDFLGKVEDGYSFTKDKSFRELVTIQQRRILYSSFYLQLYGLIESTVAFCISYLTKIVMDGKYIPCQFNKSIQREWVRFVADTGSGLSEETRLDKACGLCYAFIEEVKMFDIKLGRGGNWDDSKIEELSKLLGMNLKISKGKYRAIKIRGRDGDSPMMSVRKLRNKLSHGSISFSDCAESIVFSDLCEIRNAVVGYLKEFIISFEEYISNGDFLDSETRSVINKRNLRGF